jgi:deoxyribonuclease V
MDRGFDFYSALKELVEQVPEERATTPRLLAEALGDPGATRAVIEALKRNEFTRTPTNVRPAIGEGVAFSKFKTDHPLQRLAEHQERMAKRVVITPFILGAPLVAGVDASYGEDTVYAACVVMNRDMEIVDSASAAVETRFPYIPGYLSFREALGLLSAVRKVSGFDVLMVNGHGVAHPRGCGLASLVGIEVDKPTIGVARRALGGEVGKIRGVLTPLILNGLTVSAEVKRTEGAPIYVSVGHKIDLKSAVRVTRKTWSRGRLPEPLRAAHHEAVAAKKRDG